jgi:hypothetical protein
MRTFTITQDIATDVATHWTLFLDDAYDRAQYIEGLHYPAYELVERTETDAEVRRTIRVTPLLDLPGPVQKLLGKGFGYEESGRFDKATQIWSSTTTPNMLRGRLRSTSTVRCEPAGDVRCTRIIELAVEANVFAIGSLVESSLEKNFRTGWAGVAAYMNKRVAQ